MAMPEYFHRAFRTAFFICLAGVLFLALNPRPPAAGFSYDKFNHILAFFALAFLLRLGWPRFPTPYGVSGLLALGVGIEVVQYFIGRDAALGDVVADAIGITLAWLATLIFRPQRA